MHVAGHPDDQEVGVELLGTRIGERPGRTPLPERLDNWLQVTAGGRQLVLERPALGAGSPREDLGPLQGPQAVSEDRTRDPRQAAL